MFLLWEDKSCRLFKNKTCQMARLMVASNVHESLFIGEATDNKIVACDNNDYVKAGRLL